MEERCHNDGDMHLSCALKKMSIKIKVEEKWKEWTNFAKHSKLSHMSINWRQRREG
jgi:hypothetical protein